MLLKSEILVSKVVKGRFVLGITKSKIKRLCSCDLTVPTIPPINNTTFLHLAPCGDWWIDNEIFAAKHLPTGYIRSIRVPIDFDDKILNSLDKNAILAMYDTGVLDKTIDSNESSSSLK
eukprot:gene204-367_t